MIIAVTLLVAACSSDGSHPGTAAPTANPTSPIISTVPIAAGTTSPDNNSPATSAVSTIPFPAGTTLPTTSTSIPGVATTTTTPTTSTTSLPPTTDGSATTTTVPITDAVAATRNAVIAAASAADWDGLAALVDPVSFTYTLGSPHPDGAVAFWQTLQADGTDILGAMAAILALQPQEAGGQFVFPYFNGKSLDELTAAELAELDGLGGSGLYDEDGIYLGWTAIIVSDGAWKWFVREDV